MCLLVLLKTTVIFPKAYSNGTRKVIMNRTPYGTLSLGLLESALQTIDIILVGQEIRGTAQSGGSFDLWRNDPYDSEDLASWIRSQQWSSGEIDTFGASADGFSAFGIWLTRPNYIQGQYFIWTAAEAYPVFFPNGVYAMNLVTQWLINTIPIQANRVLLEIERNEMFSDYWRNISLEGRFHLVDANRSAFWAGWYDLFATKTIATYEGYNTRSYRAGRSKLFIDPLGHCQNAASLFPFDRIFPSFGFAYELGLWALDLLPEESLKLKNITFYVMSSFDNVGVANGHYWTSLETFPTAQYDRWYLQPTGQLIIYPPDDVDCLNDTIAKRGSTEYIYDPRNPVPTQGGNNLFIECGPRDQALVDSRADVVTFQSEPFAELYVITGEVKITLYVSTNVTDTDFMVRSI